MSQLTLITGGTSGIGLALAKVFAKNKYDIIITARKQEELNKAADDLQRQFGIKVYTLANDLSKTEGPKQVFDWCQAQNLAVDVLVNNAGLATYGKFSEADLNQQLNIINLNIRATTELTGLMLPLMLKRGSGKILNVASSAAFQPGPLWAVYAASKAYILSFSLALRNELKGSGLHVTAVCPGATKTNFQNKIGRAHV